MPQFAICTETMTLKKPFEGTLASARTKAQALATALNEPTKLVWSGNPPETNPLVQAGVEPEGAKVERFNPPGIAPTFGALTPATGPAAGGTAVVLTGTGFDAGITAVLGGNAAVDLVRVSSERLEFKTPAHAAGAVSLVLTNPDATTVTQASAFTYA